ncbi:MAG: UDP-N-acetylmuramoyl-L-alanyl-D-glutamate--2,6-diaminopimelate ligase [Gammaproteobacteria bacterium]|nr:UDP-N-acetylmuramoyl-L-alanyl-D-glutamate--2,6-diaminopimelate ligase [Gammaproteobacteria bacterium]
MKLNNLINDKRLSKNNINVLGLSENSTEIKSNYIFFLKNTKNFKRKYIDEAINKGAKLIIHQRIRNLDLKNFENKCLFYEVKDLTRYMSKISRKFFNIKKNSIKIYGVTGTNGKSSIVSYISQLLLKNKERCGIIGTLGTGIHPHINNISLTTPNIINICKVINIFRKKGVANLAMEVSSHGLSQNRVSGLDFNTVIFTNLTKDHLDYHKNMRNYFNAKLKLFNECSNKKKVVSIDNYYGNKIFNIYKEDKNIRTVSIHNKEANFYASNITYSESGINFCINSIYGKKNIKTKLYGDFTIENILLTIASIVKNKKEYNFFSNKISDLKPLEGRLNKYVKKSFPIVFIDFAHTPDAIKKTLVSIKKHFPKEDIITLFGCGGERSSDKRKIMGKIADSYSNEIIITNDNPRGENPKKIANQIVEGINKHSNYQVILNRSKAIRKCITSENKNKIVLILGKGHETKQIFKKNSIHFSDKEEVQKAFKL